MELLSRCCHPFYRCYLLLVPCVCCTCPVHPPKPQSHPAARLVVSASQVGALNGAPLLILSSLLVLQCAYFAAVCHPLLLSATPK